MFALAERMIGQEMAPIAAADRVRDLAPRPLLLLAGGRDGIVPAEAAQRSDAAAGSNAELWLEPEVGHLEFPSKADGYGDRVRAFFAQHLLDGPRS